MALVQNRDDQLFGIRLALNLQGFTLQRGGMGLVLRVQDVADPAADHWIHPAVYSDDESAPSAALGGMHRFMQEHRAGDAELSYERGDLQPFLRRDEASVGLAWGLLFFNREAMLSRLRCSCSRSAAEAGRVSSSNARVAFTVLTKLCGEGGVDGFPC